MLTQQQVEPIGVQQKNILVAASSIDRMKSLLERLAPPAIFEGLSRCACQISDAENDAAASGSGEAFVVVPNTVLEVLSRLCDLSPDEIISNVKLAMTAPQFENIFGHWKPMILGDEISNQWIGLVPSQA